MKVSIQKKHLTVILIILAIGIAIFSFSYLFRGPLEEPNVYYFNGVRMLFRANLKDAVDIPVYPDNDTVFNTLWNFELKNLTIAFVNSSDNSIVAVEAFEVTNKMKLAYLMYGFEIGIKGKNVTSYENLSGSKENVVIALIPPVFSNETLVEVKDYIIYIKAKSYEEFDLATIRFLMAALAITDFQ